MWKSTLTLWFSVPFLAAVCLSCCGNPAIRPAAATENAGGTPTTDPRFAMVTALRATGPHPSLGDHANVLGRLVGTWDVEFIDPQIASVATFTGGAVGDDRIVLDSQDLVAGQTRRWSFNDIRDHSLVFRDAASNDGGKTWKLKSEYHMKRRGAAPSQQ